MRQGAVRAQGKGVSYMFYSERLKPERNPGGHLQTSANRVVHKIAVTDNSGFDKILDWIVESYVLTQG